MRVNDVAGDGPGGYSSTRHRTPFNSGNEGLQCVSMTWQAISVSGLMSGKVLAFRPGADTKTIDGFAMGVPQSAQDIAQDSKDMALRVSKLQGELGELTREAWGVLGTSA